MNPAVEVESGPYQLTPEDREILREIEAARATHIEEETR